MSSYEKVARIGAALGGAGGAGYVGGLVTAGSTIIAAGAAPIALIVGTGAAVGAGLSAFGKFIFDSIIN